MAGRIYFNKGTDISHVAFMFACPGQKEEKAGKVVAGNTGKNLNLLLSVLSASENENIRALFPSENRYDYLITNSSDIIHYPALDGTSLPSKSEYADDANLNIRNTSLHSEIRQKKRQSSYHLNTICAKYIPNPYLSLLFRTFRCLH